MTNQAPNQPDPAQPSYTAEDSNWQDLNRRFIFIVIFIFGILVVTLYLGLFLFYQYQRLQAGASSEWWMAVYKSGARGGMVILVLGFVILFIPTVLELVSLTRISGLAEQFTRAFYAVPDVTDVRDLIQRRAFGVPPVPRLLSNFFSYPFIVVQEDRLNDKDAWAYYLGGPAKLIVYDGRAVYLERGGKFSRVVGSGIGFLERYETVKEIVDLHPQVKEFDIKAWTKDGIKLKLSVRLECQMLSAEDLTSSPIAPSQQAEKRNYPFQAASIQKAVEATSLYSDADGHSQKYDWVARVYENVDYHIRLHVYSHTINQLLYGENNNPDNELISTEFREQVQKDVNQDIQKIGARLISLQIQKVETPQEVDQQWAENWRSEWIRSNTIREGKSKADTIRMQEIAHSETQKEMILTIARSLENMDEQEMREHLILSLSDMLEKSLVDPFVQANLPKETLETLDKLQNYLLEKH